MKSKSLFVLLLASAMQVHAQPQMQQDPNVISRKGAVQLLPLFQRWSLQNSAISEASSVVSVYQPITRNASVSIRGSFGSANGDITSLSGPADVQLTGNYYLEPANLVFSLGVGIPSGKTRLALGEFVTSILLANNVFQFSVPHFGTGFNVSPGITWAIPVNEDLVLGLGATFQYRGPFSPLVNFGAYDPGDEATGTIGLDVRIDETASLSGDVVFTHYSKDKVDGLDVFAAGDKLLASLQFRKAFDANELFMFATYRTKAKAEIAIGKLLVPLKEQLEPNQAEVFAGYMVRFNNWFATQFLLEGRFFQETPAPFSGFSLVGVGVMPEFTMSENLSLPVRVKYMYGTGPNSRNLSGIEAGIGVILSY